MRLHAVRLFPTEIEKWSYRFLLRSVPGFHTGYGILSRDWQTHWRSRVAGRLSLIQPRSTTVHRKFQSAALHPLSLPMHTQRRGVRDETLTESKQL